MKRVQFGALAVGVAAHTLFWVYQIGVNSHPLGWLCGEISCWVLIVSDLPVSRLYRGSNQSVTYGSLLLGSLWWGVLAVGCTNLLLPCALVVRGLRIACVDYVRTAPVRASLAFVWGCATVAAVVASVRAILPWFTPQ